MGTEMILQVDKDIYGQIEFYFKFDFVFKWRQT